MSFIDQFFNLITAALASTSVLLQQAVVNLHADNADTSYIAAGVLGTVIFIAAMLVRPLANRLIVSEALVPERVLTGSWPRLFRLALLEKDIGIAMNLTMRTPNSLRKRD